MPTLRELADLAASLKNKIQQNKLRMRRAGVSPDIPVEILQALEILEKTLSQAEYLDELVEATEDGPAADMGSESPASLNLPSEVLKGLALGIQSSVESALEPWQSQLAHSTAQFGHFVHELQHSIKAFAQAEGDYAERAAIVEQQRKQLAEQLADSQEQLVRSTNQISEKDSLLRDKDNLLRQVHRQFSEKEQQASDQSARLDEAKTRIQLLQSALDACSDDSQQDNNSEGSNWKPKWEEAQAELTDLREQNSELAARIAQLTTDSLSTRTGRGTVNPELLSWDERKKLMLQQLEQDTTSDDRAGSAVAQQQRLDIQDVIATTHGEIERRDREIEELREIIQLQSEARQGMAIGAAGVAQLLDNNDLINEERKKLQDIQKEWEAKLRQAEIDLSMERAKLARERSELELELAQLKRSSAQALNAGQSQGEKQQRRWKNFLGLKEESSD